MNAILAPRSGLRSSAGVPLVAASVNRLKDEALLSFATQPQISRVDIGKGAKKTRKKN